MVAVCLKADAAGGESARKPASAPALEPGEAHSWTLSLARLESDQFFNALANASSPEL